MIIGSAKMVKMTAQHVGGISYDREGEARECKLTVHRAKITKYECLHPVLERLSSLSTNIFD